MKCQAPNCEDEATRGGMIHVSDPDEPTEGTTEKVVVCEHHSHRWGRLWGSWPLEKPEAPEVPAWVERRQQQKLASLRRQHGPWALGAKRMAKLSPAQRDEIIRRKGEGEAVKDLAQEFGVHRSTIQKLF